VAHQPDVNAAIFDAKSHRLVARGVGDEKQRDGVRMTGTRETFGEFEDGESIDRDALRRPMAHKI
jgi:hypothetical protein